MPSFLLQIVHADSKTVVTLPGGGALERDLIAVCTEAILAERTGLERELVEACTAAITAHKWGVGLFRTRAQVERAIAAGLQATLTPPDDKLREHIADGITAAIRDLKFATIPVA
jgi:hypothetical protein